MKIFLLIIVQVCLIGLIHETNGDGMIEVFEWKQIDYYNRGDGLQGHNSDAGPIAPRPTASKGSLVFPDRMRHGGKYFKRAANVITSRDQPPGKQSRWSSIGTNSGNSSSYIPYNNVPMGASHYKGRLFITMPRRRIGIPSTLNYIDMNKDGNNRSPRLHAYPNFETNYLNPNLQPNPNRIVSVYRTTVDSCNRLWFIDTGMLEYPDNRMQLQEPSIWIMDLNTDTVIRRFNIPVSIVDTGRGLASITIDVEGDRCKQAFAYIPDLLNRRLYVYSYEKNRIWSFSHNYFNFDPIAGDLTIGGQTFRWDDGIFSATIGKQQYNGESNVYFHPMATNNEFVVSNRVLQNEANANRSDHGNDFRLLGSRGMQHQSTMHEYDPQTGVIFYNEIQRSGIGCWNTNKPFSAANHGTVAQDARRMVYPSDLTIDQEGNIWMMTNSLPIFIYSELNPNVVNFRVWKQNVYEAIKNTICQ